MKLGNTHLVFRHLLLAVGLCTLATASFAQYGGGGGGMGSGRRGRTGDAGSSQPSTSSTFSVSRTNQVADKLYDLRMRLLISAEQSALWDTFYARAMAWSAGPGSIFAKGPVAASELGAVQAVQQKLGEAQNRYALIEGLADATKALYAVLTPEQQRTADQYLPAAIF